MVGSSISSMTQLHPPPRPTRKFCVSVVPPLSVDHLGDWVLGPRDWVRWLVGTPREGAEHPVLMFENRFDSIS